jgi:hypothetical protein
MIYNRARQSVMIDQDKGMADGGRCGYVSASFFKRLSYIPSNERFILNNEDRTRSQCGELHHGTYARLSANARGGLFDAGRKAPAVDQSPKRNKRDDQPAEGHERVAGTVMVLRTRWTVRPQVLGYHCLFKSPLPQG